MRLIAGLEQPDSGTVRIGGIDVTALTPAERKIAMVFQSYALFPHLSVAENIVFGLRVRGVSRAERDSRLQRVSDIVGPGERVEVAVATVIAGFVVPAIVVGDVYGPPDPPAPQLLLFVSVAD